jgi:hypothetical protein
MKPRRCLNCDEKITPETYDAASVKVDFAANCAAWLHGFCSRWCMVARSMATVKAGMAWWQQPDPNWPDPEDIDHG